MLAKVRIRALRRALAAAGVDPDSVEITDEDCADTGGLGVGSRLGLE
jgi:hypothetical protein